MICKNCFEILDDNVIVCTECGSSTIYKEEELKKDEVKEDKKAKKTKADDLTSL
jgi:DNA-directed RNA polymerase subunit RPC12/RpoP